MSQQHIDELDPPGTLVLRDPIASLSLKQRKLLDLYYADQIDGASFSVENERLTSQIATLREEIELKDLHSLRLEAPALVRKVNRRRIVGLL